LNALKESNIHSLWGVQCAVGGSLLEGRDVICVAPTGSGKTLAYVLPTLVRLGDPARSLSSGSSSASEKNASEKTGKGKTGKGSSSRNENNDDQMEQNEGGQGIRALIVVPTHDLAVQIEGVVKAVTRKRGWRCLVLSKATEKAICESSPGASEPVNEDDEALAESGEKNEDGDGDEALAESGEKDEDGEGDEEKDEDEEEEEEREEEKERKKGKAKKEVKGKGKQSGKKDNGGRLGIDILISTPERLHHLLEEGKISLAS
jgi:ATP-dependent RNA helicase DDX52/ROK1